MPKVKVYNIKAENIGEEDLNPSIFEVALKPEVIQQAIVAQMANSRKVLAHTKGRSEVRGGGKKPWKQKGTGRARHGSIRSPLWVGGGVTFGPSKDRNFSVKINKKMKKKALNMVLSDKVANDKFILLDSLKIKDGKTKEIVNLLRNFCNKLDNKKKIFKVLITYAGKAENIIKAGRNIKKLRIIGVNNLNIKDLLDYEYVMLPKEGLEIIENLYSIKKSEIKK
ncbi:MAG: 50S ribosomal protein L4 [bacterium]